MTTIKTAQELIAAMKADKSCTLWWSMGQRPAAPGSYSLGHVRVYSAAVKGAEKLGALKITRRDWQLCNYVLTAKFKYAE